MATYKHENGETVILVDGSWEDTRIGSLALDGTGGWSKVDEDTDAPANQAEPVTPVGPPGAEAAQQAAASPPADTAPAQPATGTKATAKPKTEG